MIHSKAQSAFAKYGVIPGLVAECMRLEVVLLAAVLLSGCMSLPRATCSDEDFAKYIHTQAETFPIPGVYELRTAAAGGHVTLGGRVDSPVTLKELVKAVANTPGLTELSFFGVEFAPPDVSDDEITANARRAAADAIGEGPVGQLGFYCEDHRLFVYGRLPSLPMREKLDEVVRQVPGVALYHVSCEIVMENPPGDDQVVAAVRRKFRRPELANLAFRASQIEVTSANNVVHLRGKAPTLLGKLSAASQAAQVEGVRYVVNHIVVPDIRPIGQPEGANPPQEATSRGDALQGEPSIETAEFTFDDAGDVILKPPVPNESATTHTDRSDEESR